MASPDGYLFVEVPPGAVPAGAQFSVQEVTNLAPGGIGPAWRLGPEGTTFPVPVTLTIFAGGTGRPLDEITVAWQDDQGYWHRAVPASVVRDPLARTLTVQTSHLSSWTLTTIPTARDFKGAFSVGTSLGSPFVATGDATFTFAGEDADATYYLLSGTLRAPLRHRDHDLRSHRARHQHLPAPHQRGRALEGRATPVRLGRERRLARLLRRRHHAPRHHRLRHGGRGVPGLHPRGHPGGGGGRRRDAGRRRLGLHLEGARADVGLVGLRVGRMRHRLRAHESLQDRHGGRAARAPRCAPRAETSSTGRPAAPTRSAAPGPAWPAPPGSPARPRTPASWA